MNGRKIARIAAGAFGAAWLCLHGAARQETLGEPSPPAPTRKSSPVISEGFAKVVAPFLEATCFGCHGAEVQKGGLRLDRLAPDFTDAEKFPIWVQVHDKLRDGEMPPKSKPRPAADDLRTVLGSLSRDLEAADRERQRSEGRAAWRRLNRFEYENALYDLLSLPYLDVKEMLPEDGEAHGFNKVSEALDISHVNLASYLETAKAGLNAAVAWQRDRPASEKARYYVKDMSGNQGINGRIFNSSAVSLIGLKLDAAGADKPRKKGRNRPAGHAIGFLRGNQRPFSIRFDGRESVSAAGPYRVRVSAYGFSWDKGKVLPGQRLETLTLYARDANHRQRTLGSFDVRPNEPNVIEWEGWLSSGEVLQADAPQLLKPRGSELGKDMRHLYQGPGLALQWLEVEGPLYDQWPPPGHRVLFGDLPLRSLKNPSAALEPNGGSGRTCEVVSTQPAADAEQLLRRFLPKAYRRPAAEDEVLRYLAIVKKQLKLGQSFTDALLAGYTAVLCSPGFLYLEQRPGPLSDHALAARLSFFLWSSGPDQTLLDLAGRGELHKPEVLRAQTERLLNDAKARRFVDSFLDYWLKLREIRFTEPDGELYPESTLDDLLVDSMVAESRAFFMELLRKDASVTNVVHSDFAMLNERLARHYGIAGVEGVGLRRVPLPPDSHRGGFLTQASVLKVTANGTTTSPVPRGVWILERILGQPPPPPPSGVPGLEPDTRGATTIREQLAKHRTIQACAACHAKIDPPGFALESFDVMGGWRERYRTLGEGQPVKGVGRTGNAFAFRLGPAVDASGRLADGRAFKNVDELKRLLLTDPDPIARNLARQLVVYATGAGIQFADRPAIEEILSRLRGKGNGLRTMIHEIVQSNLFRAK